MCDNFLLLFIKETQDPGLRWPTLRIHSGIIYRLLFTTTEL